MQMLFLGMFQNGFENIENNNPRGALGVHASHWIDLDDSQGRSSYQLVCAV